jgi:hypothetical protein
LENIARDYRLHMTNVNCLPCEASGIRNAMHFVGRSQMDIDAIRSRFILDNLRRALQEQDRERSVRAAHAFRNYFQWFGDRLPELEKLLIVSQLATLEESCPEYSPERGSRASAR